MQKKRKLSSTDEDFPSDGSYEVPDFLPPPHELAKARTMVLMTIALDDKTIAFFKREAKKRGAKYQRMIREVLRRYVDHYDTAA